MLASKQMRLRSVGSVFALVGLTSVGIAACGGSTQVVSPVPPSSSSSAAATPTAAPTATPTVTPTITPTPSAVPSSAATTAALVSGQPIAIPSVAGFSGTVTYTAGSGTSFPSGATVTLRSYAGEPAGGPAPQLVRRSSPHRFDTGPSAVASVGSTFSSSVTLTGSLAVTIPNTNPSNTYTAETYDTETGALVASIPGSNTGSGDVYTFQSTGATYTVGAGISYLTVIVANSQLTPAPSASPTSTNSSAPTATPTGTATPAPTAPASVTITQYVTQGSLVGLAISPSSRPYFTDQTTGSIGYVTANGAVMEYPVSSVSPAPIDGVFNTEYGFNGPTFGPDGNLYVPFSYQNSLLQFVPPSGPTTLFPIPQPSAEPFSIVTGPDGALWYTDGANNVIGRMTTTGDFAGGPFRIPTSDASPQQIVVGPDGALWFPEGGSGKIGRITTSGRITEYPMQYPGCMSRGIASGPLHSLWYIGCTGGLNAPTIDQVSLSGVQTFYTPPSGFPAAEPDFLIVGRDGALWFTDTDANYVGRLAPTGNGVGTWSQYPYPLRNDSSTANSAANWIFSAPDGSLWFTAINTDSIYHVTW